MLKYPLGLSDFKGIRQDRYYYIDKTAYIKTLIENGKFYFLGRPRRFGKSLFLSTMEYFFRGERALFEGLNITSYDWNWEEYPVIHIDLGPKNYRSEESIYERLDEVLEDYEVKYGVELSGNRKNIESRLSRLIKKAYHVSGRQVVVLVDEYEKPVVDLLDNPELMKINRDILRGFYSVLKSSDEFLKLVFLTGVTKFGQMSVFSGLNNITDISFDFRFGAVCGITEKELTETFYEGIEDFAKRNKTDFNGAVLLLKENYDGYHFNEDCPDIYNPYSLVKALYSQKIGSYWSQSGTPALLANALLSKKYNIERIPGTRVSERRISRIDNQYEDPIALLYHTGYLTIKSYDETTEEYILDYPNREVEHAFLEYLLPSFSSNKDLDSESLINELKSYLLMGDCNAFVETLKAITAGIEYDLIPKVESERHFQYMIYIISRLLVSRNINVIAEDRTSDGRIDMSIVTPDFTYIIEFKINSSAEKALIQINEKEYYLKYQNNKRKIFLIGMNFNTEKRRVDDTKIQVME
ncbi:MAG: ATP-binding protein [Muribaculaceae bacterium]|nr:ATP-binding protein [Muribaculaceae bacterium]